MPIADNTSATPPNNASNSIGDRRPSSDRASHSSIVRTSAIGCSGSMAITADRTCETSDFGSTPLFTTSAMAGRACWVTG